MNDLFIQYGVQAAGGPAFLKRTRTAYSYSQVQRQNSSGVTYSQLQRRDGTGVTYNVSGCDWVIQSQEPLYSGPGTAYAATPLCDSIGNPLFPGYPPCDKLFWTSRRDQCNARGSSSNYPWGTCTNNATRWYYNYGTYVECSNCCFYITDRGQTYSYTECGVNWGGWYNVSSCSANYPACSNGAPGFRECRTTTLCYWNVTQSWYNVTSCSASTPSCTNGASRVECRTLTLYDWNPWSAYEEVDICVPQSPAAGPGAVQIECVPQ